MAEGLKERAWWLAPEYAGINYRRAAAAVPWIRDNPGKTAWELAGLSGIVYAEMSKGLQKGREYGLFRLESEDRNQGGVRYRYFLADTAEETLGVWAARGLLRDPATALGSG